MTTSNPPGYRHRSAWHPFLHRILGRAYYSRITVLHRERIPSRGPVLFIGLHRNGAVDGFVYNQVLPRVEYLISTQLRKNLLARIFFDGIEVVRGKDDGDAGANPAAMEECLAHLVAEGCLFVFPEGTSSLGPRHLPFKSGAHRLAHACLQSGLGGLRVIALAAHYEDAPAFRSRAEVVAGAPVDLTFPPGSTSREQIALLRKRFAASLESVGCNFADEERQALAQRMAFASTLGTGRSYAVALKNLEAGIPVDLLAAWNRFDQACMGRPVRRFQGVPLFPKGSVWRYALFLAVLSILVLPGLLANAPPLLAARQAGRRMADGPNVIALWRLLAGAPAFVLWALGMGIAGILAGFWLPLAWAASTIMLFAAWPRVMRLAVAVSNAIRCPNLGKEAWALHKTLLKEMPDADPF